LPHSVVDVVGEQIVTVRSCAIIGGAEDYFVFVRSLDIVIPGRATWREPGIQRSLREIPGSSLRDAPE
jgi:hypothetical protein